MFWILTPLSPFSWVSELFRQDIGRFHSARIKPCKSADYYCPNQNVWRVCSARSVALAKYSPSIFPPYILLNHLPYFILESLFHHIYYEKSDRFP